MPELYQTQQEIGKSSKLSAAKVADKAFGGHISEGLKIGITRHTAKWTDPHRKG